MKVCVDGDTWRVQRYRLELVFGDNDYFVNSVLSKEYEIDFTPSTVGRERLHYYGLTITACTGSVAQH